MTTTFEEKVQAFVAVLPAHKVVGLIVALDVRQARVMRLRLVDEKTVKEVAENMGLAPQKVRQIQAKAITKMAAYVKSQKNDSAK